MAACCGVFHYTFDVSVGDNFQSFFLYAGYMLLSVSIKKMYKTKTLEVVQHFEPGPSVPEQLHSDSNNNLLNTDIEAFTEIPQPVHSAVVPYVETMPRTAHLPLILEPENIMDKCSKLILSRKSEILKRDMIARAVKKFRHRKNKIPKCLELHSVANYRFAQRLGVNAKLCPSLKNVKLKG
ncbi:hypothetical protein TNIN_187821 [Trichonephila inaurata madagascariensis]|uniref:Uncharacterized protein n=1 Tax=Trichonephila inaurata madagascariensis TaxID=2747483 RepID=A0A8X7C1T2_9ARAC|nr:hypothetical protein TNIN_187821 [Trichonephila inaurata madagascariensis]